MRDMFSDPKPIQPLSSKERQAVELIIHHAGGVNRQIHYRDLRKSGFPEKLAEIYGDASEYLDSLASRKFQRLRDKGWIKMDDAVIVVLQVP
jgi:hypothetical protein